MAERQARGGRAKEGIGGAVINRTPLAQEPVACGGRFKRGNCSVIKLVCRATPISLRPRA
jgi:hypothetical protein